jgi:cytosine/adenosine deaminase-related metal-dependent hydrolase
MGDTGYGLETGKQADLMIMPGDTPVQAIIDRPPRSYVIKHGRVVAAAGLVQAVTRAN